MIFPKTLGLITVLSAAIQGILGAPAPTSEKYPTDIGEIEAVLTEYGINVTTTYVLDIDPNATYKGKKATKDLVAFKSWSYNATKMPDLASRLERPTQPLVKRDSSYCLGAPSIGNMMAQGILHSIKNNFCNWASGGNVNWGNSYENHMVTYQGSNGNWYDLYDQGGKRAWTRWKVQAGGNVAWNWNGCWNVFWQLNQQCEWESSFDGYHYGGSYLQTNGFIGWIWVGRF